MSPARAFDLALGGVLAAAGVAETLVPFSSRQGTGSSALTCAAAVVGGVALTQRRTHPLAAAVTVFGSLAVAQVLGPVYLLFYGQAVVIGVAVFSVIRYAPVRQAWWGFGLGALTVLGADLTMPLLRPPEELVFHWSAFLLTAGAAASLRRMAHRAQESQRRAVRTEVAAAERAMAAVVEERARIARELHDIVAHAVSTMVVQAGAAEQVVEDDPVRTREALEVIRATGTSALAEMRRLVTVLRDDNEAGPLHPQPGLAGVPALVEAMRSSGLEVDLEVRGGVPALPAGLDLAAYRIVQEALTNVRRHSSATRASVSLGYAGEELHLEVRDAGPAAADRPPSGGHGLVGMRERVALYGGTLTAGPDGLGGFRVLACLPVSP
jgi:signal transduction histidine kinase